MFIYPRRYQFGSPEHLHDNYSTHSVNVIECVVAGNKVVSTRENIRSAHVEIPKVERFRVREGRKGERLEARPPNMPRGECVFWSIFTYL
jgi:hypothetical protein